MQWRIDTSPYSIAVSEIMLQQTQVDRVRTKYASWMRRFPDWPSLANASTGDVLREWSGLGYNRRALYLQRMAETVTSDPHYVYMTQKPRTHRDEAPDDMHRSLRALPGIGPNTAGSIMAFAFNIPITFIETNIRSVFIHHFFSDIEAREGTKACKKVRDDEIMPLIRDCLDIHSVRSHPREWYWALMDYGSHLKRSLKNPSQKSAHHIRQSSFKGSNREARSAILRSIMSAPATRAALEKRLTALGLKITNLDANLDALVREGFLITKGRTYHIS